MSQEKLAHIREWMAQNEVDCAYVTNPALIAYLTGFESNPHERILALLLPLEAEPFLFTPALEIEAAKASPWPGAVYGYLDNQDPWKEIAAHLRRQAKNFQQVAIEKDALTVERLEALKHIFPNAAFRHNLTPLFQQMQLRKTAAEKAIMLEAGNWADVAYEIGFKALAAGVQEQEIVAEIEYQLKRQGVKSMSFDTCVLAGVNASLPHGEPGSTTVQPNELVLFDLGVIWQGYCSDATRTVAYQEPTDFQKEIYGIVLEAQLAATAAVKPGVTAASIDKIARDIITDAGYGEYFNHRLGHGIGTTVHEFPSIVEGNDMLLEEGMCFSIEPGIYIPGKVGVRIEDCLYVTADGAENFTKTTKELQIFH